MEIVPYVKEMLGINEGTIIDTGIDTLLDQAPIIGSALQSYKISKLSKRMKLNEEQLNVIKNKVESKENEMLYKEQVFPLIVNQLMEDDEDKKSKIILDGFEYILDEDIQEIEKIYHFYDVLNQLRIADIYILTKEYSSLKRRSGFDLSHLSQKSYKQFHFMESDTEQESINNYQKNKLQRLGLLDEKIKVKPKNRQSVSGKEDIEREYNLSSFGKRFIDFFKVQEVWEQF